MKLHLKTFLLLIAFALPSLTEAASECSWLRDSTDPYGRLPWPDTNVNYWRIRVTVKGPTPLFKITGQYPYARYMSLSAYELKDQNPGGNISDIKIDKESENPFSHQFQRNNANRNYTVWAGVAKPEGNAFNNFVTIKELSEESSERELEFWYRIYVPDTMADEKGSVALPKVIALDPKSGTPIDCVITNSLWDYQLDKGANELPPHGKGKEIPFYPSKGKGVIANEDNRYSIAYLDVVKKTPLALVQFKAPTAPATRQGQIRAFKEETEVRYWSLCLSTYSGATHACLFDENTRKDANGIVSIIVGPEEFRKRSQELGYDFLPLKVGIAAPMLITRNLGASSAFRSNIYKADYKVKGKLLSINDWDNLPPLKTGRHSGEMARTDIVLPVKEVKSPEKIHFALSLNFFLGNMWKQQVSRGDNPHGLSGGSSLTTLSKAGSGLIGNRLLEGTNGVDFSLSTSDDIAKDLNRGALDIAFMPGEDFAFLQQSFPDLEPLGYGNIRDNLEGGGDFTHEPLTYKTTPSELNAYTQSVVLVRDTFDSNPNKLSETPMPLKGLRLAVYPMRSHSLTFLSQWIRRWDTDGPEGFFNASKETYTNAVDAIESLMETDGKVAADVVVVTLENWKVYRKMKKAASSTVKVFSASYKSMPPVLVYSKKALREQIEETLEDFFVRPKSRESQNFIKMISPFLGMAIGVSEFNMANPSLVNTLRNHLKETEDFTHYLLPVFFFPKATHWSQE